jgi:hypothetical protein
MVELQFENYQSTDNMTKQFLKRLSKWDPHWIAEQTFCTGLTVPVTKHKYRANNGVPDFAPLTAARFTTTDLLKIAGPRLGQVYQGQAPKDNELRILIRMLPLYLSKQKDGGKHRADVHIWPKGTYLQIRPCSVLKPLGTPQKLDQRKQQSHDTSKWLGICKHLDITSIIKTAYGSTPTSLKYGNRQSTVELGCYDPEMYMFSLAMCRYRSPQALSKTLLQKGEQHSAMSLLKRISLDEMYGRAKRLMDSNEVILDCDSDDDDGKEDDDDEKPKKLRSILFSIRDPITMAAIKNPVRGKQCKHFSVSKSVVKLMTNKRATVQTCTKNNHLAHNATQYNEGKSPIVLCQLTSFCFQILFLRSAST